MIDFDQIANKELERLEDKIEEAGEFLGGVLDILYGEEEYDADKLEFYLEELAHKLKIKMKTSTLKIQSK